MEAEPGETGAVEQALQMALRHERAGQLSQAEEACRQILARQPDHAGALRLLGVVNAKLGRYGPAVELIRRAIACRPEWFEAHYDLANALHRAGQADQAIASYVRAAELEPDRAEIYLNLGVALKGRNRLGEAIAAFRRVIELRPDLPEAYINLGNALKVGGRIDQCIAAYRQAIALGPGSADAYNNLSVVLRETGCLEESIEACRRAIAVRPGFAEAHDNLGVALNDKGMLDESLAAHDRAISLKPEFARAHYNRGNVLKDKGRLDEAVAAYRRAVAIDPALLAAHNNLVYAVHFHPGYDAAAVAEELRRWNVQFAEPLKRFIRPHTNDRTPDRRLRIGYVSPDFREHPVGRFLLPLLERHDKNLFETFAYSQTPRPDDVTDRLRGRADTWREITRLSDSQTAELIRRDRIDILVDLTMHMAHNRLPVLARKPAPVQVTWLAYCSTTGLEAMDYRLSDPYLDPPTAGESVYTEKTIRLPKSYWCYPPPDAAPEVNPLPAAQRGHVTFGCLNNFCKVSEPLLAAWIALLRAVPDSRLLLHAHPGDHRQGLEHRFGAEGIGPERIRFVSKLPLAEYLRLYNRIDIALDTFPYCGGTTTCDALWMGVPVVSLAGRTAVGRGGLSILSNIGLPEWVARSPEEYVQIAVELAADLSRLSDLRATLRRRMAGSPLMDAPGFARDVEAAYRQMWESWCFRGS